MTRLLALGVAVVALAGPSGASGKVGDLYGLRYGAKMSLLVPYDPVRLVPSGPAIRIGHFAQGWSLSRDRSRFVAAAGWRVTRGEPAGLRFVDLARGRVEGTLRLPGELRRVVATAWVGGRVLAVVSGASSTAVYSVNPDTRAVIRKVDLPGAVVLGDRGPSGVVLLLREADRIGPATLALVDRAGNARTAALRRIALGTDVSGSEDEPEIAVERPGLALDPGGTRVYVFAPGAPAAAVDLRTFAVRYAPVRFPTIAAKSAEGASWTAASLPDGRVVVAGFAWGKRGYQFVRVVDPTDWSSRVLSRETAWFRTGGGVVFLPGVNGRGLRIWQPSGSAVDLFRSGSVSNVYVVGTRAFVTFFGHGVRAAIVDLGTRDVVRHTVPAHVLAATGQPIVGLR